MTMSTVVLVGHGIDPSMVRVLKNHGVSVIGEIPNRTVTSDPNEYERDGLVWRLPPAPKESPTGNQPHGWYRQFEKKRTR